MATTQQVYRDDDLVIDDYFKPTAFYPVSINRCSGLVHCPSIVTINIQQSDTRGIFLTTRMENLLFNNWQDLLRIVIIGVLAYVIMIIILRISGKRTLSQMKEFDFIVSVALGSALSAVILDKTIALAEGVMAIAVLVVLQMLVARLSLKSKKFQQLSSSSPSLIFYNGQFLHESLRKERLLEAEVRSVIRSQGITHLSDVKAVVLEPNGQFAVVTAGNTSDPQTSIYGIRPTRGNNY